jgi:hypothetical protein
MEKTEMMKRYEQETGISAIDPDELECYGREFVKVHTPEYVEWLEAKAAAYDRLMSGGKKTLKEIANFLQHPIAIQPSRSGCIAIFANVPFLGETEWKGHWMSTIACDFDYSGDWKDSLTMPDGWEEK